MVSLPFSDHCAILADNSSQIEAMLVHLKWLVDTGGCRYVEVRPSEDFSEVSEYQKAVSYCFHRIDLSRGESAIFESFHKGCVQRRIKKAERESLTYEEGRGEDVLGKFYKLFVMSRKRQGVPPQPVAWFRSLTSNLGEHLKIRVASWNGIAVASIITLEYGLRSVYKYGCSDPNYNRLGAMPWLLWKAIRVAKEAGLDEFDLGRADLGNQGLITFKDRWGAKRRNGSYWRYPYHASSTISESRLRIAGKIFSRTPGPLLTLAGNLLYRHIG